MKYYKIKNIARKLRLNPTAAEVVLWSYISNKKLDGRKFLRQHPIIYDSKKNDHSFFVPDFYCRSEMLIVELDGPIHEQRKEYDKSRDDILKSMGYNVLRINNDELDNIDGVLDKIKAQFKNPSSPSLSAGRGSGGV